MKTELTDEEVNKISMQIRYVATQNIPSVDYEDFFQEAWEKILKAMIDYNPEKASFVTFSKTILYNFSIDYLEQKKDKIDSTLEVVEKQKKHRKQVTELLSDYLLTRKLLAVLNREERIVIERVYYKRQRPKKVAQELGLKVKRVYNILMKARNKMKQQAKLLKGE